MPDALLVVLPLPRFSQLIISLMLNRGEVHKHVLLDVAGYRERRMGTLETMVENAKNQVKSTGAPCVLPPLSSTERRQVHLMIQNDEQFTSYSDGHGRDKTLHLSQNCLRMFAVLIIFFGATQFGLHFWSSSTLVYGIRIDYLSPTLYFLDILIILYLCLQGLTLKEVSNPAVSKAGKVRPYWNFCETGSDLMGTLSPSPSYQPPLLSKSPRHSLLVTPFPFVFFVLRIPRV